MTEITSNMKKYIRTQKYEQDCSLITTINAGIFFDTIKDFDVNTSLYKHYYYNVSNGSLSPERIEIRIGIMSERVHPDINKIKEHIKKGNCAEMICYHLLTGWHCVLLTPVDNSDKVLVIDPIMGVLDEQEKKKYYNWSKPIDLKFFFDLEKSYPNPMVVCGKMRLFSKSRRDMKRILKK